LYSPATRSIWLGGSRTGTLHRAAPLHIAGSQDEALTFCLAHESAPRRGIDGRLYREANVVPRLLQALTALDYPKELLDIKLILEADDLETIAAVRCTNPDARFHVLSVPPSAPRTKPKACNYALPFTRGEFVVIYDAEDLPEPDQLRKAVAAFRSYSSKVACLQARLNFFNAKECWLSVGILAQRVKEILSNDLTFCAWHKLTMATATR
jgi:cellulose synthase/poly-beta-1,6-N-acetylglucosamine synthase-like glycosyltransferase